MTSREALGEGEPPILEMRRIRKSFAGNEVLHGIDFAVAPGEIHALVGHNGAGKSTLMKVLGGVYADYSGEIRVGGERSRATSPKEAIQNGVAIIYQDFSLAPNLDVAHNIALGREPAALPALLDHRKLIERSKAEAERFGIDLPMKTPAGELGVAQQQLIEIVRALAREAKVLVMDEPTARLATPDREQLFAMMRSLAEQGVGIVYISHFLDEVLGISDRVTILRDGAVVGTSVSSDLTEEALAQALVGAAGLREQREAMASDRTIGEVVLEASGLGRAGQPGSELRVRSGEIVALAGLVGSGRTTLARALVGDVRSSSRVTLGGEAVPRNPLGAAQAGLVLIPEDRKGNGLVMTGSMTANLELTGLARKFARAGLVRRGAVRHMVRDLIDRLGIRPTNPNVDVAAMSGGNAQKVLVGRAIASGAKGIVIDQPTAGVDVGAKADLHAAVREAAAQGTAVVVISDDLDETLELADRVLIVIDGRIVAERTPDDLDRASLLVEVSRTSGAAA